MLNGNRILAIIPARGGSKGIPRKNIKMIMGKPLIAWTIEEAKKSKLIDRIILSSEDQKIIEVAKSLGCEVPFVRPSTLAEDATPGIEPVLHALEEIPGYDYVVLLQPTSPLRAVEDIDGCIRKCIEGEVSCCVTVTEPAKHPFWMFGLDSNDRLQPLIDTAKIIATRQELPPAYALNGAVYVAKVDWFKTTKSFLTPETVAYQMPVSRSVDIDTDQDLLWVEFLLSRLRTEGCSN